MQVLGLLGAASVLMSEMPRMIACPLALFSLGYGHWLAQREARVTACRFVWSGTGLVTHEGETVGFMSLQWRGPLAFLQFRLASDGRVRRLSWWPDTLDTGKRRELRLAMDRHAASRRAPRMAG